MEKLLTKEHSKKTVMTAAGKIELDIPRDTEGSFGPVIVKKHERSASMRQIYTAINEKDGQEALNAFEEAWGKKYPYAVKSWRTNWPKSIFCIDAISEI